jgi:putative ABC transport system ATP-binding protein
MTRDLITAGLTLVLVSHNAFEARRIADQVLVLHAGQLTACSLAHETAYLKEGA